MTSERFGVRAGSGCLEIVHQQAEPAAFIDWIDFGLPVDTPSAYRLIVETFDRVRSGEAIEVGCAAGNGRTGCIIACMAILAGTAANDAVEWTRSNYCLHAIDTSEQERWVEAFTGRDVQPGPGQ